MSDDLPNDSLRAVWCLVVIPEDMGVAAFAVRERRWVDAEGRQWRNGGRQCSDIAPIMGDQ